MKIKLLAIIFGLIFLFSFGVYAVSLGIYPGTIEFSGKTGEKICRDLKITASQSIILYGEDNWSNSKTSKDFKDYKETAEDFEATIEYPRIVSMENGEKNLSVCITGEKGDKYSGILIYKSNKGIGVATWIRVNIEGENEGIINLTGNAIKDNIFKNALWPLLISFFVSLVALGYLLGVNRRKSKEESETNQEIQVIEKDVNKVDESTSDFSENSEKLNKKKR